MQAVEALEGVPVRPESHPTATVSYQSFFAYYERLAGMTVGGRAGAWVQAGVAGSPGRIGAALPVLSPTARTPRLAAPQGTAATEQLEFAEAYGLNVVRVPPHRPSRRTDHATETFFFKQVRSAAGPALGPLRSAHALPAGAAAHASAPAPVRRAQGRDARLRALLEEAVEKQRPVLIGTGSVEESIVIKAAIDGWVAEWEEAWELKPRCGPEPPLWCMARAAHGSRRPRCPCSMPAADARALAGHRPAVPGAGPRAICGLWLLWSAC